MNWRENAHLFANGKFKAVYRRGSIAKYEKRFLITGIHFWKTTGFSFLDNLGNEIPVDKCTLIARPIADMTDEEVKGFADGAWHGDNQIIKAFKADLIMSAHNQIMRQNRFLYLLSIGIYPFDQSHFETGDVIKLGGGS